MPFDALDVASRGGMLGQSGKELPISSSRSLVAGHQEPAVGFPGDSPQLHRLMLREAQNVQVERLEVLAQVLFVGDSDDRILAINGGRDAHAEVNGAA